mmetsp:Transcript_43023/g.100940  ORF Transcript_43023/g.100940 Transcript_43023/m.100940 type:complete len:106 (-) Transcript_43023:116-433(-)
MHTKHCDKCLMSLILSYSCWHMKAMWMNIFDLQAQITIMSSFVELLLHHLPVTTILAKISGNFKFHGYYICFIVQSASISHTYFHIMKLSWYVKMPHTTCPFSFH